MGVMMRCFDAFCTCKLVFAHVTATSLINLPGAGLCKTLLMDGLASRRKAKWINVQS
jgi:hypothetical protein